LRRRFNEREAASPSAREHSRQGATKRLSRVRGGRASAPCHEAVEAYQNGTIGLDAIQLFAPSARQERVSGERDALCGLPLEIDALSPNRLRCMIHSFEASSVTGAPISSGVKIA
jgi:hypothetical protein